MQVDPGAWALIARLPDHKQSRLILGVGDVIPNHPEKCEHFQIIFKSELFSQT
jgi:hypothetical protein